MNKPKPKTIDNSIAEKISLARKNKGLSQSMLGHFIGSTRSYISKVELGIKTPSPRILSKIAKVLDIPIDELLDQDQIDEIVEISNLSGACKDSFLNGLDTYFQQQEDALNQRANDLTIISYFKWLMKHMGLNYFVGYSDEQLLKILKSERTKIMFELMAKEELLEASFTQQEEDRKENN